MKDIPYNKDLIMIARELRNNATPSEKKLWTRLRQKKFLGLDFYRQKIIGNYIADLYCDKKRIVIEIDGGYHINRKKEDGNRDAFMLEYGIKTIRVSDTDVLNNINETLDRLKKELS